MLSLLPMRSDGVRQTISFISTSVPGAASHEIGEQGQATSTFEVLEHSSKLLSTVPSSVSADDYFASIAPQLLSILDDADKDSRRVAAYIVSRGILNGRVTGAPGTPGWKYLVEPLFQVIRPGMQQDTPSEHSQAITSQALRTALRRLSTILLSHPNPAVLKRVMARLVLPIWAIMGEARDTFEEFQLSSHLLQSFITEADTAAELIKIVDNIRWSGESQWAYKRDPSMRIEIVPLIDKRDIEDKVVLMKVVPMRASRFVDLLGSSAGNQDAVIVIFHVFRGWLGKSQAQAESIETDKTDLILRQTICTLVGLQLVNRQLSKISQHPSPIIDLIVEFLDYRVQHKGKNDRQKESSEVPMTELKTITASSEQANWSVEDEKDFREVVEVSLNVLKWLLPDSKIDSGSPPGDPLERVYFILLSLSREKTLSSSSEHELRNLISRLGTTLNEPSYPQTEATHLAC